MSDSFADDPLLRGLPGFEGRPYLDPCVILRALGSGGMGTVYLARHQRLGIDVALKCLRLDLAADCETAVLRFRREARMAAAVSHPCLVRVYDVLQRQGLHYMVMEYVPGETARRRVRRRGPLSAGEALAIVRAATEGLAAAHDKGIVHRDVKPDNILISVDGTVKLADLGLAKALEQNGEHEAATLHTVSMGTPSYMPPEQWEDARAVGPAADVYAMGATLHFLLCGDDAIGGKSKREALRRALTEPFPDLRAKLPGASPALAALVARCTAYEAGDRPRDGRELLAAIDALGIERVPVQPAPAEVAAQRASSTPLRVPGGEALLMETALDAVPTADAAAPTRTMPARSATVARRPVRGRTRADRSVSFAPILGLAALVAGGVAVALVTSTRSAGEGREQVVAAERGGDPDVTAGASRLAATTSASQEPDARSRWNEVADRAQRALAEADDEAAAAALEELHRLRPIDPLPAELDRRLTGLQQRLARARELVDRFDRSASPDSLAAALVDAEVLCDADPATCTRTGLDRALADGRRRRAEYLALMEELGSLEERARERPSFTDALAIELAAARLAPELDAQGHHGRLEILLSELDAALQRHVRAVASAPEAAAELRALQSLLEPASARLRAGARLRWRAPLFALVDAELTGDSTLARLAPLAKELSVASDRAPAVGTAAATIAEELDARRASLVARAEGGARAARDAPAALHVLGDFGACLAEARPGPFREKLRAAAEPALGLIAEQAEGPGSILEKRELAQALSGALPAEFAAELEPLRAALVAAARGEAESARSPRWLESFAGDLERLARALDEGTLRAELEAIARESRGANEAKALELIGEARALIERGSFTEAQEILNGVQTVKGSRVWMLARLTIVALLRGEGEKRTNIRRSRYLAAVTALEELANEAGDARTDELVSIAALATLQLVQCCRVLQADFEQSYQKMPTRDSRNSADKYKAKADSNAEKLRTTYAEERDADGRLLRSLVK